MCLISSVLFCFDLQERNVAEAENRPLPPLRSSEDIRPLKMDDFKYAHEQVHLFSPFLSILIRSVSIGIDSAVALAR